MFSEATVKVRVCNEIYHEVSDGNGPVNALDLALRKALIRVYPALERMALQDYKVRILDSRSTAGDRLWSTVGASTNIIEASWRALYDSFEYFLLTDGSALAERTLETNGDNRVRSSTGREAGR